MEKAVPQIDNADPIGRFLRRHYTFTIILIPLLFFSISCLLDYIQTLRDPGFLNELLQDTSAIAVRLFVPLITGAYIWIVVGTNSLFAELFNSGVFDNREFVFDQIRRIRPLFRSRGTAIVITFLSCLIAVAKIVSSHYDGFLFASYPSYLHEFPEFSAFRAPFWFIICYATGYVLMNVVFTIFTLRKLIKVDHISLWLSHPDGCGGLSPISKFNLRLAFPFAAIGLVISLQMIDTFSTGNPQESIILIIGIILYFLAAPLVFFLPLSSARKVMIKEKQKELLRMAKEYSRLYKEGVVATSKTSKELKEAITKLEDFNVLYLIVRDFPIWPFDKKSVKRFTALISAPILSSFLLEILKKIL